MTRFDWTNFHDRSTADFSPCDPPPREPDFVSASGSRYWREPAGVIRESDHWMRGIRSCNWFLAGASYRGPARAGFCRWEEFCAEPAQCEAWRLERAAWQRAYEERQAQETAEAQRLAALLVPGNAISAVRQVTERLSSRRWQRITERVTFTLARQTRLYYIAADGRRFAKHTLSQFTASSEGVAHG